MQLPSQADLIVKKLSSQRTPEGVISLGRGSGSWWVGIPPAPQEQTSFQVGMFTPVLMDSQAAGSGAV